MSAPKRFRSLGFIAVRRVNFMGKILSLALALSIISYTTPLSLLAAPEVVIGYANISARVSPLWIAQRPALDEAAKCGGRRTQGGKLDRWKAHSTA